MSDIGSNWFSRKLAAASRSTRMPAPRPRRSGIMVLEPRMMYDAAAGAAIGGAAAHHHHGEGLDHAHAAAAEKTQPVTTNTGSIATSQPSTMDQRPNVQTPPAVAWSVNPAFSTNPSTDDRHGPQGSAASTEPMPHVTTWVKDPTEIVFIDPAAPDYQILASGVKPGIEVVVLDPNSDGVQQIANFLKAHPDPNLTTIDIVAHGQDGMLFLGNTVLSNANVGQYTAQLGEIGAALKGGDLMLYGCDVAANPDGLILLDQIVQATGADVAASTGPVGSAAEGGSWSLNVNAGPITASSPFTAATMALYPDLLNAELVGIEIQTGVSNNLGLVFGVDNNGNAPGAASNVGTTAVSGFTLGVSQIQLDVADGLYFVEEMTNGSASAILEGTLSQALSGGGTQTLKTIYSDSNTSNSLNGFYVDIPDNLIFINHAVNFLGAGSTQLQVINFSAAHFGGTTSITNLSGVLSNTFLDGMVVDPTNHAAYFYETSTSAEAIGPHGGISTGTAGQQHVQVIVSKDELFKATWNGTNANPNGFALSELPIAQQGHSSLLGSNNFPTSLGAISGLALDTLHQTLYLITGNVESSQSGNSDGIYSYSLSGNTTGAFGTVWTQTSAVPGALQDLIVDPQTNKYYVSVNDGGVAGKNVIYSGSLTGGANPVSFIVVNGTGKPAQEESFGLALDEGPVLALTGSGTPNYNEQGTAAAPLAGSLHVGATDPDNTTLSGATITLGNSFAGDVLTIGSLPTGIAIDSVHSTATTLVLTGNANLASYETAFENLTYSSTSDNPTNYGTDTTRTVSFTVTDGVLSSNSVSTALSVTALNDAPVNHGVGTVAALEDTSTAITGISVTDVDSNPTSDTIQVVLSVQQGALTVLAGVTGGLTSGEIAGNGGATVTLTGTQNEINATLAAANGLKYQAAPNFSGTDTLTVTTDDQGHTGGPGALQTQNTGTINVGAVNDAPDLTPNSPVALSYATNLAPVGLLATGAVSDIDNPANFAGGGFSLSITAGAAAGDGIVLLGSSPFTVTGSTLKDGATTIGTITGLGTSSVSVTALTSAATPTEVNELVEAFGFQATNTAGDRTVTMTFNDGGNTGTGGALSDSVAQTVHVKTANAAPVLTLNVANVTASEQIATALAPGLTLTDADSTTLLSAKVQLTSGYVTGEDVLNFTNTSKIQGTFDAAGGTLTLTAIAGQSPVDADFQAALRTVTYNDTKDNPTTATTRTVVFTVQDPDGTTNGGHDTSSQTATITVSAVNDAPTLSVLSNTISFTENGTPLQLLPAETVGDVDAPTNFNTGFVQVALANSVAGDGIGLLSSSTFTVDNSGNVKDGATIIGTVHAGTGFGTASVQVDLNANATASEVNGLLQALSYVSTSDGPSNTTRTATVTFNDGDNTGSGGSKTASATVTINVIQTNDPVTAAAPASETVAEDASVAVTGLSISDLDANFASGAAGIYSVTLSAGHGTLTLGTIAGLAFDGGTANGTGTLTFHGTLASINTALATASYAGNANYNGSDTIALSVTDSFNGVIATGAGAATSDSKSVAVTVSAVNDPVTAAAPASETLAEDSSVAVTGLSIADVDTALAPGGIYSVTLSAAHGTLTLGTTTNLSFDGGTANATSTLTFHGTLADINTALATASYSGTANFNGTDSISFTATDSFNGVVATGSGSASTVSKSIGVTVNAANDPVTAAAPASETLAEDSSVAVTGLAISDIDTVLAPNGVYSVTLSAGHGALTLATTAGLTFDGGTINGTGTLTFHGTLAGINTALGTASYAGNPDYNGSDTISFSVTDSFNGVVATGAGVATSDSKSIGVTVTAVNDQVTAAAPVSETLAEDSSVAVTGLSISDVDATLAPNGIYSVTLSAAHGALTLGTTANLSFDGGTANATSTLTFHGTLADIDAALATASYAGSVNYNGTDSITFSVTDSFNGVLATGAGSATSDSKSVGVTVSAVNDPVTASALATEAVVAGTSTIVTGLSISDVDAVLAPNGIYSVTLTASTGTLSLGSTTNLTFDTGTGAGDITMTFHGTLADIDAALATTSYTGDLAHLGANQITFSVTDKVAGIVATGAGAATTDSRTIGVTVLSPTTIDLDADNSSGATGNNYDALVDGAHSLPVAVVDTDVIITDAGGTGVGSAVLELTNAQTGDALAVNGDEAQPSGSFTVNGKTVDWTSTATAGDIKVRLNEHVPGSLSAADMQSALQLVKFDSTGSSTADRTIQIAASGSAVATTTVFFHTLDLDSTAAGTGFSTVFTEAGGAVAIAGGHVAITDPDAGIHIAEATITLTNPQSGDSLAISDPAALALLNITATTTADQVVLTGSGNSTSADFDQAIALVTFANSGQNPGTVSRDITVVVTDDAATPSSTNIAHTTVQVHEVNDPPVIAAASIAQSLAEDTPLTFSAGNGNGIVLSDPDNSSLDVTLSAANGIVTLSRTTGLTIVTGANGSGSVEVTGLITDINAALEGMTYQGAQDFNGSDALSIVAKDNGTTNGAPDPKSTTASVSLTVTAVNDHVTAQAPASETVAEDTSVAVTGLSISDVDANFASGTSGLYEVTLSAGQGTLTLGTISGLTFDVGTGNGTSTLTFHGTLADIDTALATASYQGNANFNGSDSIAFTVSDQVNGVIATGTGSATSDSKSIGVTVTAVNDQVTAAAPASETLAEDGSVAVTGLSISDVDAALAPGGVYSVTLSAAHGTLTLGSTTNLTFDTGTGSANATMTFHGTLADINAALATASYAGTPDFNGSDAISFSVTDSVNGVIATGAGSASSDSKSVGITVTPVNDQVTAQAPASETVAEDTSVAVTGLSISDVDANFASGTSGLYEVTLSAGQGTLTLGTTSGLAFDVGTGNGTSTLTFHGTLADIDTALATASYQGNANFNGSDSIAFTVSDQVNGAIATGTGSATSDSKSIGVTVTAVNDQVTAAAPASETLAEDGSVAVTGLSISDVDAALAPNGVYSVTLSAAHGTLTLGSTTNLTFDTGTGSANATMTFHGTLADINAALATASYAGTPDFNGSDAISFSVTDSVNGVIATGAGSASSDSKSVGITVTPVNDQVTAQAPASETVAEDTSVAVTGLSISDVDANFASGTSGLYEVTLSAGQGTLTLGTTSGLAFDVGTGNGTSTLTFHGTLADIDTALATASYQGNANFNGSDSIAFTVGDQVGGVIATGTGSATSDSKSIGVTVTAVNDQVTAAAPASETLVEDGSVAVTGLSISDVDAALAPNGVYSVTLSAAHGTLTLGSTTNLSFDAGTGSSNATMTFHGTLADINAALATASYAGTPDFNGTDAISFSVTDSVNGVIATGAGSASSDSKSVTITATAVNDAPVVVAPTSVSATTIAEDTPSATGDMVSSLVATSFSDAADDQAANGGSSANTLAGIAITGDSATPAQGTWQYFNGATWTDISTGVGNANALVLSANTELRFDPALNFNGTPGNLTVHLIDNSLGPVSSGTVADLTVTGGVTQYSTATVTIGESVTPVNDAPVLSGVQTSAAFTPGGSAVALSTVLSVNDVDNTTLAGATVSVSAGTFLGDGDVLSVNGVTNGLIAGTSITAVYNAGNETLTLSGTDSLAHYQNVLEQVQFRSTSIHPTNSGNDTSRTISWQLDDGSGAGNHNLSTPVTSQVFLHTLDLDGNNSTAPGTAFAVTYTESGTPVPVADIDAVISDNDSSTITTASITLTDARATDVLSINGNLPSGILASSYVFDSATGTGLITLTGSASTAAYQSALNQVVFSSTSGNIDTTDRDIAVNVTDSLNIVTNTAHATISIIAINNPPDVEGHGGTLGYTENQAATVVDPLLTLSDPDSANIDSATVTIIGSLHPSEDMLGFTNQNGITASYDSATGVLSLTGASTVANYEKALQSVTYFNTSDNPSAQTRTISFQAVDDGGAASNLGTSMIAVTPVNDAAVVNGLVNHAAFIENGGAVALSAAVTVTDVDSTLLTGAKVAISNGFVAGDTLNVDTTGTAITASYNSATGVLTLSGTDTQVDYQQVLASVSFNSSSENPTNFGAQPTRTLTWSVTDLDQTSPAHANQTATVVTSIDVTAVNDAPVITTGNFPSFNANAGQPMVIDGDITVSDVDSLTLSGAKVTIAGGFEAGNDSLNFVSQHGISGSYDHSTGVLTLSGLASVNDYQQALASVTFGSITQANGTRTIQWTVDDGSAVAHASLPTTTTMGVSGIIIPFHLLGDNGRGLPSDPNVTAASFVGDIGTGGPLVFPTGEAFSTGGGGSDGGGFHVMHTDPVLTTASDATVQIKLALASLEAPLGDITYVVARQANGDPLPDWLKFDPATGTFAGIPPDHAVASIAPDQSDNDIMTGSIPPKLDLGSDPGASATPHEISIEVTARDSRGNIAVTIFTIVLQPSAARHGWNINRHAPLIGHGRHASLPAMSPELAAIEAAVRDVTLEPFALHGLPVRHGDAVAIDADQVMPAGRAGLTQQLASIGWRSMAAQRDALLASLQGR